MKKIKKTIELPDGVLTGLCVLAAANGVKVKSMMEIVLQKYVDDNLDKDMLDKIQKLGK